MSIDESGAEQRQRGWRRLWARLTGSDAQDMHPAPAPATPPATVSAAPTAGAEPAARPFETIFEVVEVADADFLAGALFRRRFATNDFPATPKHFVAFHRASDGALSVLGYVHFEIWKEQALGGGLVIDERAYRRLPAADRATLRAQGGVAEAMLRQSFALLPDTLIAIWAYIGDALSEKVNRRVGFLPAGEQYIRVIWRQPLSPAEQAAWLEQVVAYGPF